MMRRVRSWEVGTIGAVLLLLSALSAAQIASADALVRSMHDRYAKSWYETLTFTQKSTTYNDDGTTKVETWYELRCYPESCASISGLPRTAARIFWQTAMSLSSTKGQW